MSGAQFQMLLGSGIRAALTFVAGTIDTSGLVTSHNFSIDCGSGGNVAIALTGIFNGTFTAVTIGGQTGSIRVQRQAGGNNAPVAIATASGVPAGTQTITVTSSAGNTVWVCMTYNLSGVTSLTPASTGSDAHVTGGCSGTLSNPAFGCTLGITQCGNGGTPVTWTGLTKDDTEGTGVAQAASAHQNFSTANAALAWSTSFGGSNNQTAAAWASWGP